MNYLVELIIRPQRNTYNLRDLGDSAFSFSGQDFRRIDFINGQVIFYLNEFKFLKLFLLQYIFMILIIMKLKHSNKLIEKQI